MKDREGAEKACANPNPVVDGRRANVNLAYIGAKPKSHSHPGEICSYEQHDVNSVSGVPLSLIFLIPALHM